VIVARDIADFGEPDFALADLRDEWSASEFDLKADAMIAENQSGEVVAYAAVRRRGSLVSMHPEYETMELGEQLLRWAEQQERERDLGRAVHRQWVGAGDSLGTRLLFAAGYHHVRSYRRMVRDLGQVDPWPVPDGIRLRPIEVERDAPALHAVDGAAFSSLPDFTPGSLAGFTEEHLRAHDTSPALSLAAMDGEAIVGFLLTRRWQDHVGFVDILAVHPSHQRRGLGGAMLSHAFASYATAGLREAQLGVASDNPRALSLYARLGMRVKFHADTYEKPVAVVPGREPG